MDTLMAAQEHVALARSLFDLFNSRQSDPAWLEKSMAAYAADCEDIDVPSGTTLHGPDGHKRIALFFVENFPDLRVELTNAFATEDQVVLEGTWRWNDTGPLRLPSGALPATRRPGELRCCYVYQVRKGKIVRVHHYYDMLTLLEQLVWFLQRDRRWSDLSSPLLLLNEQRGGQRLLRDFCLQDVCFS